MEVLLNSLAIFSITFIVVNISLSAIFSLVSQQLLNIEVKSRKVLLWLIALLPWLVSLAISVYILQAYHGADVFSEEVFDNFPHWHHMSDFEWYSWHGITVGLAICYLLYMLTSQLYKLWFHKKEVDSLLSFSTKDEAGIYQVESEQASAFTTGFFAKKCIVTTGLVKQTSTEEYDVVIKHEMAHKAANDPVKKWLFALLCSFFISPIKQRLKLHMTLAMEQAADNTVIKSGISTLFVASTLVKVAKFNAQNDMLNNNDLVANFGADVLEQRIYFLLGKLTLTPLNKSLTSFLVLILIAISTSSIDGIHHFMETLFSH